MNKTYYETLDENFKQALKLYEENYTHDQLIEILKSGNIVQKQIAALRLDRINSFEDAAVLLDNLTGQDGKVREAVSLRLDEFMKDYEMVEYFILPEFYTIFLDAAVDINANICRSVINAIKNLRSDDNFCKNICSGLTKMTFELLDKIEKFDIQEGKYKINKEVFKLYWCLETIYEFYDKMNFDKLREIILRSKNIPEYTIREKTAKILTRGFADISLDSACKQLQEDENYYVRNVFTLHRI